MPSDVEKSANGKKRVTILAYASIIFVIFLWGVYPVLTAGILEYFSGGTFSLIGSAASAVALTIICIPRLKLLNASYLRVAVPTGFAVATANLIQKIGLEYTTPSYFAFLENLSCITVPIMLYIFIKKKPGLLTCGASFLCLVACFLLSGAAEGPDGFSFGKGEILCAIAGIIYGINIAATGAFAKKLDVLLYVMIHMWVSVVVSGLTVILLDRIKINGEPVERIVFSTDWRHIAAAAALVLFFSTFGWLIRTEALKFVNASVVAVMMPFSSLVTGVVAVLAGRDNLTFGLIAGGALIIIASVISGVGDALDSKRQKLAEGGETQ